MAGWESEVGVLRVRGFPRRGVDVMLFVSEMVLCEVCLVTYLAEPHHPVSSQDWAGGEAGPEFPNRYLSR